MKVNEVLNLDVRYLYDPGKAPNAYIELKLGSVKKRTKQSLKKLEDFSREVCEKNDYILKNTIISKIDARVYKVRIDVPHKEANIDDFLSQYVQRMFEVFNQYLSIQQVLIFAYSPITAKIIAMHNKVNLQLTGEKDELKGIDKKLQCQWLNIMDFKKLNSGLLSLFGMKNIRDIQTGYQGFEVINILNKHLKGERDVLACQEEMIAAGFKQYARL